MSTGRHLAAVLWGFVLAALVFAAAWILVYLNHRAPTPAEIAAISCLLAALLAAIEVGRRMERP